jgi:hypothetical protein
MQSMIPGPDFDNNGGILAKRKIKKKNILPMQS